VRALTAVLAAAAAATVGAASPPPIAAPGERTASEAQESRRIAISVIVGTADSDRSVRGQPLDAWRRALATRLAKAPPEAAADALAPSFGLTQSAMRRLALLWIDGQYDPARERQTREQRAGHDRQWFALLAQTHRAPLVLEAAAATLAEDDCDTATYDRLLAGKGDPAADGWRVVQAAPACAAYLARFAETAPDRAGAALAKLAGREWLPASERLAILDYLRSPAGLARVDPAHREAVRLSLTRLFLWAALKADVDARAVAAFEAELPAVRSLLLKAPAGRTDASFDGLPFTLDEYATPKNAAEDTVPERLAAAYALAGRTAEAEALFANLPQREKVLRQFHCLYADAAAAKSGACGSGSLDDATIPLLDHLLHHTGDDPYPIAEIFLGGGSVGHTTSDPLACRVFRPANVTSLCVPADANDDADLSADDRASRDAARRAAAAATAGASDPDRRALAAALAAARPRTPAGSAAKRSSWGDRPAVDPLPPPFEVRPIPAAMLGTAPAEALPKGAAPLPEGFEPVRVARQDRRVAVVSVSQNYDPTGEVSRGGYWIHLSDDGGRTWRQPFYTGLADAFPFVVLPNPRLPLFDGETLTLAVDRRELDTSSITYPPVGLRTRRIETNLAIRVPIAELERDSDGDGVTDLAARHLLLAPGPDGAPPAFVVGRQRAIACTGDAEAARPVLEAVLKRLFSVGTGALIEPIDADRSKLVLGGRRGAANGADRPIFIEGDPADYGCLRPDRLMIVYTPADLERLRRMSPDFHAAKLERIVFNRARDRGYLVWSSGWTGGTFRLRRTGSGWAIDDLSSWIS
jgi:hypothetical protein